MPKSELLNQILTDYLNTKSPAPEAENAVADFCSYADQWFAESQPVGVGRVSTSLSIRLADGREFVLFDAGFVPDVGMPSMGITGNTGGSVRAAGATVVDASQPITGR